MYQVDSALRFWILIWVLISVFVVYIRWKKDALGIGLIFSYMIQMWVIHGIGGFLYTIPDYENFDPSLVAAGFQQATYGFIALGIGSSLIAPYFILQMKPIISRPASETFDVQSPLSKLYIVIGLFCYLFLLPIAYRIPSATAITAAGWRLVTVGAAISLWKAWQYQYRKKFRSVLLGFCIGLPLLTVTFEGFLGYGSMIVLSLIAFVGSFYHPRWKLIALGALFFYVGFSIYISYMQGRESVREAVWGGASLEERSTRIRETFQGLVPVSLKNSEHLMLIDERLNQNVLVGAGVDYLHLGFTEFALGETIRQAFIGLIPRALWPSKPTQAGSGDVVAQFTGIQFSEGTSVGTGQVLELYINFGTVGVFLGFLILSIVVAFIDSAASQRLKQGDLKGFAYFYLPGLSLIETGSSLFEMISSCGAGLLTIYLVNRYLLHWVKTAREVVVEKTAA